MYAVIFKAITRQLNADYFEAARRMRELAMQDYDCVEFNSVTEAGEEISISYWNDLQQIKRWKQDAEHQAVQAKGKKLWYQSYQVQVVEVLRHYSSNS